MHPGAHCRHCGNWPRYGHIPLGNSPYMSESWRSVLVPPLLMGLSLLCKGPFKTLLGEVTISLLLSHTCALMTYFHTFLLFVCSAAQNHGLSLWKDCGESVWRGWYSCYDLKIRLDCCCNHVDLESLIHVAIHTILNVFSRDKCSSKHLKFKFLFNSHLLWADLITD